MIREPHFTHFALAELHPFAAQFPLQDVQGKKGYVLPIGILYKTIPYSVIW